MESSYALKKNDGRGIKLAYKFIVKNSRPTGRVTLRDLVFFNRNYYAVKTICVRNRLCLIEKLVTPCKNFYHLRCILQKVKKS